MALNLPVHPRQMDTPRPSEVITCNNGEKDYRWLLTKTERSHIADMLEVQVYMGIHSKEFMLDVLANGPRGPSPKHTVYCSGCTRQFDNEAWWLEEKADWKEDIFY
ncbi:hypothetical protein BDW74DRAFT_184285 [Aspergillus multicolor]|uniref:uncharacterized protein n=1 Tax=Aspergillus multicolor TaxID=41759 RepID=UPI003CCCBB49